MLKALRERHDLRRFEFTRHLRVAPTELPHSHPVLTLNTQLHDPDQILCEYLHEQMHWYAARLGCADEDAPLIAELMRRYPNAPTEFPEGAPDAYSTYLHLLVNWLEIEAASQCLPRSRVEQIALAKHYYRWIYRTVVADWGSLELLFGRYALAPLLDVPAMSVR